MLRLDIHNMGNQVISPQSYTLAFISEVDDIASKAFSSISQLPDRRFIYNIQQTSIPLS